MLKTPSDPRTQPSLVTKGTAILALPWRRAVTWGPVPVPARLSWQRSLNRLWALRDEATLDSWHLSLKMVRCLQVSLNAVLQSLETSWRYSLLLLSLLEPDVPRLDLTSDLVRHKVISYTSAANTCARCTQGLAAVKLFAEMGGAERGAADSAESVNVGQDASWNPFKG